MVGGRIRWIVAAFALVVVSLFAAPAVAVGTPSRAVAFDALEPLILAELNTVRAKHGLRPLRLSPPLSRAADLHSREMGQRGFFAHDSVDGSAFWKRVQRFYPALRSRTWTVGENLLWNSPTVDAPTALRMWMDSPKHRANILDRAWREIGISAVKVDAAPGVFGGRDVVIVTTDFGVRR